MAKIIKKGKYYYTQAYIGTDILTGKRKYKRFKATSRDELKYLIAQAKIQRPSVLSELSIRQVVELYLHEKEKSVTVATMRTYRNQTINLFPDIVDVPIYKLTKGQINACVNDVLVKKKRQTVLNEATLVNSSMKFMGIDFHITLPKHKEERDEFHVPSDNEVQALIDSARGTDMELPIILGAKCGLRRGEVLALTYSDVDFERHTISVTKSNWNGIIKPPKTPASVRTLDLTDDAFALILERQKQGKELIGVQYRRFQELFNKIRKATGLQMRFHDLRHYYASVLLALGISDRYAITFTGHSSPTVLRKVYQHIFLSKKDDVRLQIKAFFNQNTTENATDDKKTP